MVLTPYVVGGTLLIVAGLSTAVYVQTSRLHSLQAEYSEFKGGVKALGDAARVEAEKQILAYMRNKEKSDAENGRRIARLNATVKQLRSERASGSFLPSTPKSTGSPDTATFDRAELERAIRGLDTGVQGLVDKGSKAVIDLDTAKEWGKGIGP